MRIAKLDLLVLIQRICNEAFEEIVTNRNITREQIERICNATFMRVQKEVEKGRYN